MQSPESPTLIATSDPTVPIPVVDVRPTHAAQGGTTIPRVDARGAGPPIPRRNGGVSRNGLLNVVGAALFAICFTTLIFGGLGPFSGVLGAIVVLYLTFVASYATLVSISDDGPAVRNAIMTAILWSAAAIALIALVAVIAFTFVKGWPALHHANFFTQDLSSAGPLAPLHIGGVLHALVGSLWMPAIALAITVPLGVVCAVYLNEARGALPRLVRTVVEAMTALPSVLAGLFIFATWILILHFEKSGLAAALALSVEMLPIVIRGSDVVLRLVPGNLREASYAVGAPVWRSWVHVVLPTARSGLITAIILATARGIGETAPVLLTAGYTTYLNTNPVHGPMVSLPLAAFQLVRSGQANYVTRGFAAAAFLMLVVLLLFVLARLIGGRGAGNLSARQLRKAMRMSRRDSERFIADETATLVPNGSTGR